MKKSLLLVVSFFTMFSLAAQVNYTSYGDGWVIPANSNTPVDVDGNGITDFYVNGYQDELGFVPIYVVGCFTSPSETAYVNFGARELTRHQEGDLVQLNSGNLYDYIDDGRGSAYSLTEGFAEDWVDMEDVYIGFVVLLSNGLVENGWLKMAIDEANQTLIIKEIAYTDEENMDTGGIVVGDRGEPSSVSNLNHAFGEISVSPNPANDFTQLSFEYFGNENLTVIIQNSVGQEVYRSGSKVPAGNINLNLSTGSWNPGVYFIRFETIQGIRTERLSIAR